MDNTTSTVDKTQSKIDTIIYHINDYINHDKIIHAWEMYTKLIDEMMDIDAEDQGADANKDRQYIIDEISKFKQYFKFHGEAKEYKDETKNKTNTHKRIQRLLADLDLKVKSKLMQKKYKEAKEAAEDVLHTIGDIMDNNPAHFRHDDDSNAFSDEPFPDNYFDAAVNIHTKATEHKAK